MTLPQARCGGSEPVEVQLSQDVIAIMSNDICIVLAPYPGRELVIHESPDTKLV